MGQLWTMILVAYCNNTECSTFAHAFHSNTALFNSTKFFLRLVYVPFAWELPVFVQGYFIIGQRSRTTMRHMTVDMWHKPCEQRRSWRMAHVIQRIVLHILVQDCTVSQVECIGVHRHYAVSDRLFTPQIIKAYHQRANDDSNDAARYRNQRY